MRKFILSLATLCLLSPILLAENNGTFGALKKDQKVSIKEISGKFIITLILDQEDIAAYKIKEIGSDYIKLEDITGITEIYIPIYSVRSVHVIKIKR